MKTVSTNEAQLAIIEIMNHASRIVARHTTPPNIRADIGNVGFADIFKLYSRLITHKKRLYLPGEVGTESVVIVYNVAPGIMIWIESEPCVKLKPKINLINWN